MTTGVGAGLVEIGITMLVTIVASVTSYGSYLLYLKASDSHVKSVAASMIAFNAIVGLFGYLSSGWKM